MSFDKNISYKNSWLSQFGLYRYENASRQNRYSYCNFGLLGIIGVFIGLFALIVVLASNLTIVGEHIIYNDDTPKRIIIIAGNETPTTLGPSKTTFPHLNHQIYKNSIVDFMDNNEHDEHLKKTTPMTPTLSNHQSNGLLFDQNENDDDIDNLSMARSIESLELHRRQPFPKYKMNRRKIDENLDDPRPFDYYLLKGTPPSAFQINKHKKNMLASLFPPHYGEDDDEKPLEESSSLQPNQQSPHSNPISLSFPDIPKDYSGAVSSIQDIIEQLRNDNTDPIINNHLSLPELLERNGRKIRFGGTYRHRKNAHRRNGTRTGRGKHFNHQNYKSISNGSSSSSSSTQSLPPQRSPTLLQKQPTLPAKTLSKIVKDPFYQYKPQSLSDINLLATDKFRFSPPNPASVILKEMKPPVMIHDPSDPAQLYQQIISANNEHQLQLAQSDDYILESDRQNSRNGNGNQNTASIKKKTKPFQLMLDVYPMIDDELPIVQPTRRLPSASYPSKLRKPIMMQIPSYFQPPSVVNAINNLPLHLENQYFQNMNFPQVNYNRASIDSQNNFHNLYVKKFPANNQMLNHHKANQNNNQKQHYQQHNQHQQHQHHQNHPQHQQLQEPHFQHHQTENTPSQITVHLNLFPKNKRIHDASNGNLRKSDKHQVGVDELNVANSDVVDSKFQEEVDLVTEIPTIVKTNEKIDKGGLLAIKTLDYGANKLESSTKTSGILTNTDMTTIFNDLLTESTKNNNFVTEPNQKHQEQEELPTTTESDKNQRNEGYVNFYKNINFMYTTTIPIEPRDYVEIPTLTRGGIIPHQLPDQIVEGTAAETDEILK